MIDSISGLESENEKMMARQSAIREGLRKVIIPAARCQALFIVISQTSAKRKGQYMVQDTNIGDGVKFHATYRIEVRKVENSYDLGDGNAGIVSRIIKVKDHLSNRVSEADLVIGPDGIDDEWTVFNHLDQEGIISNAGAYKQIEFEGEKLSFFRKDYKQVLRENDGLFEHLFRLYEESMKAPQ